ncbi:HNH endonuclease signature motif containing protein [Allomesorhizobium alhagi]|uniref:Endonuclease n=1 Tax=Mesorhizobium alhagi CCNWXJ12-2 TaxID=1107882 RepID=H0HQV3_9HYPH|nr:HNH endonuclease signature motif containing protein [Mesorhizobium alhagi]EHK56917.1 endonuclease [Mesorhizobium alhagi CCNWXJ12-2]
MAKLRMMRPSIKTMDTRTVKVAPKTAEPFYLSPEWRKLMAEVIAERGRRCEECSRTNTRIFGDHIVEVKDGGALLDKRNVKCLCGSCHTKKTAAARAKRMAERY